MFFTFTARPYRHRRHCYRHFLFIGFSALLLLTAATVSHASSTQQSLTLAQATQRALESHPELQVFQWQLQAIDGIRESAKLRPGYQLGIEAENIAGNGNFAGRDSAELTLSISSVIELGNKRSSRLAVADSRYALAQAEREAKALDLLGWVTQRFITTLSLQEKLEVAIEATQIAEQSYQLVSARTQRGASPEAERLRAHAGLQQARMHQSVLGAELDSHKFALASLWQADEVDFNEVTGSLFDLSDPTDFPTLYQRLAASPAIQVFASNARLRDAELALARSQSVGNIQWSLGVRRFEDTGNSAFTADISVPLFAGRRNRGEVQSALAEQAVIRSQRDAELLVLKVRLFEAWTTYQQSSAAARQIRSDVIPTLEQALELTQQAYELGRYSYLDWITAQRELLDARLSAINAASTALLNQALIEQLTAEPLNADQISLLSPR